MSKEWKCEECEKHGTGACYNGGRYYHDDCQYMVIDVDYAYQQGRADAIDEYAEKMKKLINKWIDEGVINYCNIDRIAEQLKGAGE